MEKVEEKTKNIQSKRRKQSSSPSSAFPLDVASTILEKLPAKSVVRFGCVSKPWSSITTDPYFINSFGTSSSRKPSLLICFREDYKLFVFSVPQHNENPNKAYSYSTSQPIHSYHMTYPKHQCSFSNISIRTESVHGLICFQKSTNPIVWNPTMRKLSHLTKPEKSWKDIAVFLGYDPIQGKHKVMCIPKDQNCNECRVLTLGSTQESWRTVRTNHDHRIYIDRYESIGGVYGRCIKGVVYYQAKLGNDRVIMSFNVRCETFSVITVPGPKYWEMDSWISYQGKLACVDRSITMFILEDTEKHEWSTHVFPSLSHYDDEEYRNDYRFYNLVGSTNDGELFYARNSGRFRKSLDILFLDPRRGTFRRVAYTGIVDDDFRERNGLGHSYVRCLHFFPDHIESLMSL